VRSTWKRSGSRIRAISRPMRPPAIRQWHIRPGDREPQPRAFRGAGTGAAEIGRVRPASAAMHYGADASTLTDRIYRWLAGRRHVNAFTSAPALAADETQRHAHLAPSRFFLAAFLNAQYPDKRPCDGAVPRRSNISVLLNYVFRLLDRPWHAPEPVWCARFSGCAAPVHSRRGPTLRRCGADTPKPARRACSALADLYVYACPLCGAVNLLAHDSWARRRQLARSGDGRGSHAADGARARLNERSLRSVETSGRIRDSAAGPFLPHFGIRSNG